LAVSDSRQEQTIARAHHLQQRHGHARLHWLPSSSLVTSKLKAIAKFKAIALNFQQKILIAATDAIG
jgi:hypothetical protein